MLFRSIAVLRNDNHQVGSLFMMRVDDRRVTVNSDFERVEVAGERAIGLMRGR